MRVSGVSLHQIHQRTAEEHALPLLLLHGWPDSFLRYTKALPLLDGFVPYVEYQPGSDDEVTVPTGVTIFPKDLVPAPRQFAERFFESFGGLSCVRVVISLPGRSPKPSPAS